jgi:hypothetical protein
VIPLGGDKKFGKQDRCDNTSAEDKAAAVLHAPPPGTGRAETAERHLSQVP